MRWFFILLCSFLLVACTPMEWRRGDEVATVESDVFQQCHNRATLAGMRFMPFPSMFYNPIMGVDRSGRSFTMIQSWSHSDQLMAEHTAMMQCMLGQNFNLVPMAPPSQPTVVPGKPALEPGRKGP